jgi:hypothetical protein
MPATLRDTHEVARADPELLALIDEIALMQTKVQDLLAAIKRDGLTLDGLATGIEEIVALLLAGRYVDSAEAIRRLLARFDGAEDRWVVIDRAVMRLVDLVEKEARRRLTMHAVIPTETAALFARDLLLTVREYVTDPSVLAAIRQHVAQAIGQRRPLAGSL